MEWSTNGDWRVLEIDVRSSQLPELPGTGPLVTTRRTLVIPISSAWPLSARGLGLKLEPRVAVARGQCGRQTETRPIGFNSTSNRFDFHARVTIPYRLFGKTN